MATHMGEGTVPGIEWQFRNLRKVARDLQKAVAEGRNPTEVPIEGPKRVRGGGEKRPATDSPAPAQTQVKRARRRAIADPEPSPAPVTTRRRTRNQARNKVAADNNDDDDDDADNDDDIEEITESLEETILPPSKKPKTSSYTTTTDYDIQAPSPASSHASIPNGMESLLNPAAPAHTTTGEYSSSSYLTSTSGSAAAIFNDRRLSMSMTPSAGGFPGGADRTPLPTLRSRSVSSTSTAGHGKTEAGARLGASAFRFQDLDSEDMEDGEI